MSGKLSWSHYCELLIISDKDKRAFYEQECQNASWSVRELKRQIETSLFERLLLSDGSTNKETVLALSRKGIAMSKPEDILREPYFFEFLGAREQKPIGIVLCADKHDVMAEYALGGLENTIFASRYVYYIPDKEQLINEVKSLLEQDTEEGNTCIT
ncbi:hypothetical protein FACS1894147_02230 [Spirochaetia bacterium]|nr:hypothetical protein FACS1894147_02230 [Spirochaetia bacterium]